MKQNQDQKQLLARFEETLLSETNRLLRRASLFAALFGVGCGLLLIGFQEAGLLKDMLVPILWAFLCGLYGGLVHLLSRRGGLTHGRISAFIFIFSFLPASLFTMDWLLQPAGPVTYITGPGSYLYFFIILISGFSYNRRLSLTVGVFCGLQYMLFYLAGADHLKLLSGADPLLIRDITDPPIYLFKALSMVGCGYLMGVLSDNSRALMTRSLREEREKARINSIFGQFVSREVSERILSAHHPEGELTRVALLMSDLRNFTGYSESNEPRAVVADLNRYLGKMVTAIRGHRGTVDKFIGDAILANFGGLVDIDSPADQALQAARRMFTNLVDFNREQRAAGRPEFQMGIGLHYGEVLQGVIGSGERKEFTVIGDSVNTAARVESLCKELGQPLLLTESLYAELSPSARAGCEPVRRVRLRGKQKEITLYAPRDLTTENSAPTETPQAGSGPDQ